MDGLKILLVETQRMVIVSQAVEVSPKPMASRQLLFGTPQRGQQSTGTWNNEPKGARVCHPHLGQTALLCQVPLAYPKSSLSAARVLGITVPFKCHPLR